MKNTMSLVPHIMHICNHWREIYSLKYFPTFSRMVLRSCNVDERPKIGNITWMHSHGYLTFLNYNAQRIFERKSFICDLLEYIFHKTDRIQVS